MAYEIINGNLVTVSDGESGTVETVIGTRDQMVQAKANAEAALQAEIELWTARIAAFDELV